VPKVRHAISIKPDPVFGSELAAKFINCIMDDGKKSAAEKIFYGAIERANTKQGTTGLELLEKAMANVRPNLEVKSRRVGGATYQVPIEVNPRRQRALAIRWLLEAAVKRSGKSMAEKLGGEFVEAATGGGTAVKKREDVHKMAMANKAFAHYRW
jgi:small subunit ribosomal protein S7